MSGLGLHPDAPVIPADNALAYGQPDAGAGILVAGVEALEQPKYALPILGCDSDAVIADRKDAASVPALAADMHLRPPLRAAVL